MNGRGLGCVAGLALGAAIAASCGGDARNSATTAQASATAQSSATATAFPTGRKGSSTTIVATDTPAIETSATAGVLPYIPPTGTGTVAPAATGTSPPATFARHALTPIAFSPGEGLTASDLAARGMGGNVKGTFRGERVIIPKIGVDAPMTYHKVGLDGVMPQTDGPDDIAFYDFSDWSSPLGGFPGIGGNVVTVGLLDFAGRGPAVLFELRQLVAGDLVQVRLQDGTLITYAIEFNKVAPFASLDFDALFGTTADESITLYTGAPPFAGGSYQNRRVAWGRRVE
jgi:hypothetical protein